MLKLVTTIFMLTTLAVAARGQEVPHPKVSSVPVERQRPSESESIKPGYLGKHNPSRASIPTWILRISRDRMEPLKADIPLINKAVGFMRENPTAEMMIVGHAGGAGTEEYNLALGERRAKAVQQLLVTRGIELERLTIITAGAARPYSVSATGRKTHLPHRVELVMYREEYRKRILEYPQ